jgi:hypothetical protein
MPLGGAKTGAIHDPTLNPELDEAAQAHPLLRV